MSKLGYIKVAAASPEVVVANPQKNLDSALKAVNYAVMQGCQVVCLPELYLTSSTCGDLFKSETLYKKSEYALSVLLKTSEAKDPVIIIGLPVKCGYRLYNCAAVIKGGKILGVVPQKYNKNNRYFSCDFDFNYVQLAGQEVPFGNLLFKADGFTFAVEIGDDKKAPVSPAADLALAGANVIFNPSADVCVLGSKEHNENVIKSISERCACAYISASSGKGESSTDFVFSGACSIAENGKIIASTPVLEDSGYAVATVDIQKINAIRLRERFDRYSNKTEYRVINFELPELDEKNINIAYDPHPFASKDDLTNKNALAIQCAGLKKRMSHTGIKKLVLGISGGLDSTLALLVAHKAVKDMNLPKSNIICITMPGFGTTDATYQNAVNLINALGAEFREIDIKKASIQHMTDIGHDINIHDVTYENTQARERTQILMDIANKESALLIGTGDLSEAALGWCTYNGDHMSMYNVNCGVPKTFVRCIVDYVARSSDKNVAELLENILNTPVSPELLPPDEQGKIQQKTEDTLGPYEVHDFLLYHFVRYGYSTEKLEYILKRTFKNEYKENQLDGWLKIFLRRFFINQFKRSCVPDGPKVGTVGLSPRGDWQMPSDADFSEWMS